MMMPRQIAPLLASDPVKEGLRAIARSERKSMSWVVEEVVIEFFHLRRPKYKNEKPAKVTSIRRRA